MKAALVVLLGLLLAGCDEKPQRLEPSREQAAGTDPQQGESRQRTLRQGESDRIYQQGTLR